MIATTPHRARRWWLRAARILSLGLALTLQTEAREVTITILATTDLHGTILPTTDYDGNADRGGLARVASKIAELRQQTPNALLVDCGDTIQGTAVSFLDRGRVMVKLLNALKYDAWTLGNHEFDWGTEVLADCLARADMPVLAANLKPLSDDARKKFSKVQPFIIREVDGVKVGIVGLTTPGIPNWSRPRLIAGLEFEQSVVTLRRVIPEIKQAGAQLIVLAVHQGIRDSGDDHANQLNAIAYGFPELAVIIGGHTHRNVSEHRFPRTDILYCQPGYWGTHLGRISLVYDTEDGRVIRRSSTTFLMDESVPLDPQILELSRAERVAADKELARPLGTAAADFSPEGAPRQETPLHNLLSEAIAEALQERGVKVDAVVHGLLNDRAALRQGPITMADVWNLVPYENFIGVVELSTDELREILQENANSRDRFRGIWGMRMQLKWSAPPGQRLIALTDHEGKALDPGRRYRVAFNSYDLASGGQRFPRLREIAERPTSRLVEFDFQTRDALAFHIRRQGVVKPRLYGWWSVADKRTQPPRSLDPIPTAAPVAD